jgi:hypothetical protein
MLGETQHSRRRPLVDTGKTQCLAENASEPDHCAAILRSEPTALEACSKRTD